MDGPHVDAVILERASKAACPLVVAFWICSFHWSLGSTRLDLNPLAFVSWEYNPRAASCKKALNNLYNPVREALSAKNPEESSLRYIIKSPPKSRLSIETTHPGFAVHAVYTHEVRR